jgi:hypothetical protein
MDQNPTLKSMLNNQSTDGTKAGLNRNTDLDFFEFQGEAAFLM